MCVLKSISTVSKESNRNDINMNKIHNRNEVFVCYV